MTDAVTADLVLEREFTASPEAVFAAFIDPALVARWFGPVGWHVPLETIDIDARPGGHQRMVMVNDDDPSMTSPVNATIVECDAGRRLVGQETWEPPGADAPVTMMMALTLHPAGTGTRLEIRQGPYSTEMVEMARGGWESSFTKLDALLES